MNDLPTDYKEIWEFVEQNDAGVVANVLNNHYVAEDELRELVEEWRARGDELENEESYRERMVLAGELEALINND